MSESRFNRVGWFDDHQSTPSKKPPEPTTAAGRALHDSEHSGSGAWPPNFHNACPLDSILAIEAEARAAAKAEYDPLLDSYIREAAEAEAKLTALQEALLDIERWTWGEPTMSGERYPNMLNRERIHKRAQAAIDALRANA